MTINHLQEIHQALQRLEAAQEAAKADAWQDALAEFKSQLTTPVFNKLQQLQLTHSEMQMLSRVDSAFGRTVAYQDLVAQVDFSQGMLSRYVKRLTAANLLTRFHQDDNKKAIFISVTGLGQVIAAAHQAMHDAERTRYTTVLATFDDVQLQATIDVLTTLAAAQEAH